MRNIKMNLKETGRKTVDKLKTGKDKTRQNGVDFVNKVMNTRVSQKAARFLPAEQLLVSQ